MDVTVTALQRRSGAEVARVETRNEAMHTAVMAALDDLVESGKLIQARSTIPDEM